MNDFERLKVVLDPFFVKLDFKTEVEKSSLFQLVIFQNQYELTQTNLSRS
jgi:hypothetical protein